MFRSNVRLVGLAMALLLTASGVGGAQTITGSLIGTVTDGTGLALPGVTITLTSETRATKMPPVVANANGDFVVVNVPSDTYTVEVTLPGFKTFLRPNVAVTSGDRISMGTVTMEVGGVAETVTVRGDAPLVQANSGERSYTATRNEVENLPMAHRSFTQMSLLAPGVIQQNAGTQGASGTARIGGAAGDNNYVMDGSSTMDTGSNRPLIQVTTEAVAEVKVLVSGYQAEYGRSAGLQIIGTTKSGSNQFRGGIYDIERNSAWNANSKTNKLNGDAKPLLRERDLGYSIGGPVGKPGGSNKLFFFQTTDFGPRTQAGTVTTFRVPSALERKGDFSETRDNNGNLYNLIKDPRNSLPCTMVNTAGCFADGGVVGRIPADQLSAAGMQILNWYPAANIDPIPADQAYNLQVTQPKQTLTSWAPTLRLDYQANASLRLSYKFQQWTQQEKVILGTVPGFNDTIVGNPGAIIQTISVNATLNPTTFFEANLGINRSLSTGCALGAGANGTGAEFCQEGSPVTPFANRAAYMPDLTLIYPNASFAPEGYHARDYYTKVVNGSPAYQDGNVLIPPTFAFGSRVSPNPPTIETPGQMNKNRSEDLAISLTKVAGPHTFKVGYYNLRSYKLSASVNFNGAVSFAHDAVGTNPFDTSFGFANAAIGTFSSFSQPGPDMVERNTFWTNREVYVQDSWKLSPQLTLDLGMRFVNQPAVADTAGLQSNWRPADWSPSAAPRLYVPGCLNGVYPCSNIAGARQAMDPGTGQLMGANSVILIGTVVPNSGDVQNGVTLVPKGESTHNTPFVVYAPRVGFAYDLTKGAQKVVVRGGGGVFYNRGTSTNALGWNNPPLASTTTYRYSRLQESGGLSPIGAPTYSGSEDQKIPTSSQWNLGVQAMLPGNILLDVAYQRVHAFNGTDTYNYNAVVLGDAYRPENQDRTLVANAVPGATPLPTILYARNQFPGAANASVVQASSNGWSKTHTLPIGFTRRFQNGLSFGFNDNIVLSNSSRAALRFDRAADNSLIISANQGKAQELLGGFVDRRHIFKGNFVWQLPKLGDRSSLTKSVISAVANDWQLSGVWTGWTGPAYGIGYSYTSNGTATNLTGGGPAARVIRLRNESDGCSGNPLQQFDTTAYQGPGYFSDGLESGEGYLRGCRNSVFDMALARTVNFGGSRRLSIRVDVYNVFDEANITGRNTTMNLASPNAPTTITNLPYDAAGDVVDARSRPRGAGFGVANAYQAPRTVQVNLRFSY